MRKILLLSATVAVLFVGSIFVGIAAATTGAPVLYDARSPQPVATDAGGFDVEAGEAHDEAPGAPVDGARSPDGMPLPSQAPDPTPPSAAAPVPSTPTPMPPPTSTPDAPDDATDAPYPTPEEQQAWLEFQQVVRDCMAEAGHEYLHWEWWHAEPGDPSSTLPAMPEGLTSDEVDAWELALHGEGGAGDDVPWEQAGCWGVASHTTRDAVGTVSPNTR